METATPYDCNDKIDGIDILCNPSCSSLNVVNIFKSTHRRRRSHGLSHYTSPTLHDVSINESMPFIQKSLAIHHIPEALFITPFKTSFSYVWKPLLQTLIQTNTNLHQSYHISLFLYNSYHLGYC